MGTIHSNVKKPGKYQYFAFVVTSLQTGSKNGFITLGELSIIPSCPNDDIAPKMGCMCGENGNVCNEGQKCNVVVCLYPPPSPVSVIFLIIGLFFALTLMFSFVLYLNLLIK